MLKSLEEVNRQALNNPQKHRKNNGIACPDCKEELSDSLEDVLYLTFPAKIKVVCEKCKFIGYKYI